VHEDHGGCRIADRRVENFPRVDDALIQGAFGNLHFPDNAVFPVQEQDDEVFLAAVSK